MFKLIINLIALLLFANVAIAQTCDDTPTSCTPAQLCAKTTENIDNVRYWIPNEKDNYLKIAKKFGLDCDAKDPLSPCQRDENSCSIVELCEISTTNNETTISWNDTYKNHVKLAKSFGLKCGVNVSENTKKTKNETAYQRCERNLNGCEASDLCEAATWGGSNGKKWKIGAYTKYVKEAKRRKLSCGVIDAASRGASETQRTKNSYEKCKANPENCSDDELCSQATYTINNKKDWRVGSFQKYSDEAKRRGMDCGVTAPSLATDDSAERVKTPCDRNPAACITEALCERASSEVDGKIVWREQEAPAYVAEAKKRKLSCSPPKATNQKVEKKNSIEKQSNSVNDVNSCKANPENCSDDELCSQATYTINNKKDWRVGSFQKYSDEAKRRGMDCGVGKVGKVVKRVNTFCKKHPEIPSGMQLDAADRLLPKIEKIMRDRQYLWDSQKLKSCDVLRDEVDLRFTQRSDGMLITPSYVISKRILIVRRTTSTWESRQPYCYSFDDQRWFACGG